MFLKESYLAHFDGGYLVPPILLEPFIAHDISGPLRCFLVRLGIMKRKTVPVVNPIYGPVLKRLLYKE